MADNRKKGRDRFKALERYAARVLGGRRVSRGDDFGQSLPDVLHDYFGIECKSRQDAFKTLYDYLKQAADYDKDKVPLIVVRRKGKKALAILELDDLAELYKKAEGAANETTNDSDNVQGDTER